MESTKRRKAPRIENPYEEYEMMKHRAESTRIQKALEGRLSPSRQQVLDKLNRERKEHEERLEGNHYK